MRLLLNSGFDRYSGYGNDAVDMACALERRGVDVHVWPLGALPPFPREFTRLLEKPPVPGEYDVAMRFAPPIEIVPHEFARAARIAVGYSMWERSELRWQDMAGGRWDGEDDEGHPLDLSTKKHWWSRDPESSAEPKDWLDAMVVTTPMNVAAFRALDADIEVFSVPCGVDTAAWAPVERPDRPVTFGMIGVLSGRKDPWVMLETWKALKDEGALGDARLLVHDMSQSIHPRAAEHYGMVLTHKPMSQAQVREWYGQIDVFVSTSRGEGNNKPAMEALSTGAAVIATDWSGHQNWLHDDCCWRVDGVLRPVEDGSPVCDFRLFPESLGTALVEAASDLGLVRKKGRAGIGWMQSGFDWDAWAPRMERVLMRLAAT